ncbi:hypothetical protein B0H13DRAFT_2434948 [Mycena leptocephala]|nr:hypothetical protein B0H13DRAFT_2434948 [Mycena leptocephala]
MRLISGSQPHLSASSSRTSLDHVVGVEAPEDDSQYRPIAEVRRIKNRAAAASSRRRRKEEFHALEDRVAQLEMENAGLRYGLQCASPEGLALLMSEIDLLRAKLQATTVQEREPTADEFSRFPVSLPSLLSPPATDPAPLETQPSIVDSRPYWDGAIDPSLLGGAISELDYPAVNTLVPTRGNRRRVPRGMVRMTSNSCSAQSPLIPFIPAPHDAGDVIAPAVSENHPTILDSELLIPNSPHPLDQASLLTRTHTMSAASAASLSTPNIASPSASMHLVSHPTASSPTTLFDSPPPSESRGKKRKIGSVYSQADDVIGTTEALDDTTNTRVVSRRLSNSESCSMPAIMAIPTEEPLSPVTSKAGQSDSVPSPTVDKLHAISSSPSVHPYGMMIAPVPIPLRHMWRHPCELEYVGPHHQTAHKWSNTEILAYMVDNAFTVPSRNADNKQTWVELTSTSREGVVAKTVVPCGYRIPLLWLGKVQWDCLKLLLTTARRHWDNLKWDVLHIARVSGEFLAEARKQVNMKGVYRDIAFDRAMARFFKGWMGSRDEFVWDFYREFRNREYEDDILQRSWPQKVVGGIRSFAITEAELKDGITAEQFMRGLVFDREKGTFDWTERDGTLRAVAPTPAPAPSPASAETGSIHVTRRPELEEPPLPQVADAHLRRPSPLTIQMHDNILPTQPTLSISLLQEQMDGMRHAQEDGEAASAQGPVPAVVVKPETVPITPDQQPTPTVLASAVLPISVHVDSAAEAFSTIDVPPTSAVDAEAAPPADGDDVAVVAPLTVDVDSAAESSSAIDAPPTSAVDAEATPPIDTDDIAVATVLASAVVPVTVNVDSTAEPSSATDALPTSAVGASAATNSNDIAVEVLSTFDSHASGENRAVDSVQRVISRRDLPLRSSFSSAAHAKPLCWSARDLERFIPLLPSSSELPRRILNQVSVNLTQTRDQIRECHAVLQAHGCIADPPSTSDIGLCLEVLERHFGKA